MQQYPLAPPPSLDEIRSDGAAALFLDFDGTLVDIAPTHNAIEVPADLSRDLEYLSSRLEGRLALVSGRSLEDLASHIGELAIAQAGSHGADSRLADGSRIGAEPRTMPLEAVEQLKALVEGDDGPSLEIKTHGAAVHYRARPEIEDEVIAAASEIAARHGLAVKRGKCVIELLADTRNKGNAVHSLMAEAPFVGSRPIFIGDDFTDEDGFAAVKDFGGLGILVGGSRETLACYRLESPHEVHRWLGLEIE
ncbi:trehalose-phosphatase [Altererythrobacter arenosus]|uniref:Trehalose 6-phosphate phosphatase n=1 Tax=Altererythrobacter arenosus TaxID=3032592 RepID=A0ABY8FRZ4_9SPHN|nr:trehalose-phosphatase [Altererythrobacter sp. CAU 1644]WFL77788.1 trehalose-phosphatase [Altererythrobacter sp. CAU 1644]